MEKEFECSDGAKLFYQVDDYTDPWRSAQTVLFVHGIAESSEVWRAWVPHFAGRFRVIRLDVRGFGRSTPMTESFNWSLDLLVNDLVEFIRHLDCGPVHLVGAKSGGTMTFKLAADYPELVQTLAGMTPAAQGKESALKWAVQIREQGIHAWARDTMQGRLGSKATKGEFDWWVDNLQGKTPVSTMLSYLRMVPGLDIRADVERICCPTLIIASGGGAMHSLDSYKAWQPRIRNSEFHVVEGDAWHAAGAYPDLCARKTLAFLEGHGA